MTQSKKDTLSKTDRALAEIQRFLLCETPAQWIEAALSNQDVLLIDHAHCEKKAASTALSLLYRYADRTEMLKVMSRLAREELRHFEQVLDIISRRGINYGHLSPSRYASGLRDLVRTYEPARFVDILIVGAFVEARSCERFAKLAPFLDDELASFYRSLLRSEGRHYQDYLSLAQRYSEAPITDRIRAFAEREQELILGEDKEFRFHSGLPA